MKRIIESIREYLEAFEGLKKLSQLDIEYILIRNKKYSIEELALKTTNIIATDIEGNSTRKCPFVIAVMFKEEENVRERLESSGLFGELQEWIEVNNEMGILPKIEDKKITPTSVEVLTSAYFEDTKIANQVTYQMECQLIYEKEKV